MKASKQAEKLLQQMTLKEKLAQLTQLSGLFFSGAEEGLTGPLMEMGLDRSDIDNAGSVLSVFGAEEILEIQRTHMRDSRLKIPLLFMADIVHGYRTVFPIPLAMACTWDMEIIEECAQMSAAEAAADGQHVTFSPMVDVVRDSRWGRVMESTGEDPWYNGLCATAFVRGFQGDSYREPGRLAACVKHFIGYGFSESGREYNTVDLSEGTLRDFCLPPFQAALDAGCDMVMSSFNTIYRIPATGNRKVMKDLLRDEIGFDGVLISDWGAVNELINHSIAEDGRGAAKAAMNATLDIEMMSPHYLKNIEALVRDGDIQESQIDEAVLRVLALKEKMGLFEDPYKSVDPQRATKLFLCEEHRKISRKAAEKAPVLLKNENRVLPLESVGKICVTGPYADTKAMLGGWFACGRDEECVTLLEGLRERLPECDFTTNPEEADLVIVAVGEHQDDTGESTSRADLSLPKEQLALLERVRSLGKPVVAVVFSGRALELLPVCKNADAVLQAWFLGNECGHALAALLTGDVQPQGRLTVSIPYKTGQMPLYYNCYQTGRPKLSEENPEKYVTKYIDCPNSPLFPFGYGLSYTEFSYENAQISADRMTAGETLTVSVSVLNTGRCRGTETVQLYLRDVAGTVVRPSRELKGYEKIELDAGEKKTVSFEIKESMLKFWNDGAYAAEAGSFLVYVGANSRDCSQLKFTYREN